jgi:hypothetical protein
MSRILTNNTTIKRFPVTEPKGLVLRQRTETVLSHSHQLPPLTIPVSSILNVAAFQDAAPVVFCVALCNGYTHPVLDAFLSSQPSPFLIVNGLRLEIQIRLLEAVILVFSKIRLMAVISYCSV